MLPFIGYAIDKYNSIKDDERKRAETEASNNAWDARRTAMQGRLNTLGAQLGQIRGPATIGMEGSYQSSESPYQGQKAQVGEAYKAKTITGPLPEYNYIRNRIAEQTNQANDTAQDVIKRRFAAMGALNSGAAIKQAQLQNESAEKQKMDALQGVDFQEAQARRDMEKEEAQKEYQSQEAMKGRQLAADEAYLGRQFSADQAMKARSFEGQQQILQRNMQREFFNADQQFKADVFKFESGSKLAEMDMQMSQLEQDRETTQFNKEQAEYQRKHSGGLFGMGGFMGLGI